MQTLKFIGRGSAFNTKEGNTSAYIKDNDELFLIDCGENIFGRILEKNILDGVKKVFVVITHLNSDHVGSLSSLIYYCYYVKKIKIQVGFPNFELYDYLTLNGHDEEYDYICFDKGISNQTTKNIIIAAKRTSHINTMNCYGYDINYFTDTYYYSGDSNEFVPNHTTTVYQEIYQDTSLADYKGNVHLSLRRLCEEVPKEQRHLVYVMHLDCDELIEKAREEDFNVVEME